MSRRKSAAGTIVPKQTGVCKHTHDHVHIPYTYIIRIASIYMYQVHVHCTCTKYMYHVHVPCTSTMSIYQVHVPCTCTMYMHHVHVPCTMCIDHFHQIWWKIHVGSIQLHQIWWEMHPGAVFNSPGVPKSWFLNVLIDFAMIFYIILASSRLWNLLFKLRPIQKYRKYPTKKNAMVPELRHE